MARPKDLPRALNKLWDYQYEQKQRKLLSRVNPKAKKGYNSLSYTKKISLIDSMVRKGML